MVFHGKNSDQVSVLDCCTAFSSVWPEGFVLGRGEVGSLSKQASLDNNRHMSVFSQYHSVVYGF